MKKHLIAILTLLFLLVGCQRTDFDELRRIQEGQQDQLDSQAARLAALEAAVENINGDIAALRALTEALEGRISLVSYTATDEGYRLTMSDGSFIDLRHGEDGKDALQIGVAEDPVDGIYYWTLGGAFIEDNGQRLRVTGRDGQDGAAGVTPQLRVNTAENIWEVSYDGGTGWTAVLDANGTPVPATGQQGEQGPAGPEGPQGPSGLPGFSIEAGDDYLRITYGEHTYTVPRSNWQIAMGQRHSLFVSLGGQLYATGDNRLGQLGLGDVEGTNTLTKVPNGDNVLRVAAGDFYTVVLKKDGTLWVTGQNISGQLGLGDDGAETNRKRLEQVPGVDKVSAISAGARHTLVLKKDGTLWVTGQNSSGQLGLGDVDMVNTLTPVPGVDEVSAIAAGGEYTLVSKQDGMLWAAGYNYYGRLGLGDVDVVSTLTPVPGVDKVSAISAGYWHSLVLKEDGTLWGTGYNNYGQLGLGDNTDRNELTQIPFREL